MFESEVWAGINLPVACQLKYGSERDQNSPAGVIRFFLDNALFDEVAFEPFKPGEDRLIVASTRYTPDSPFDPTAEDPFQNGPLSYRLEIVSGQTQTVVGNVMVKFNPYLEFGLMRTSWNVEYTHELHEYDSDYKIKRDFYVFGQGFTRRVDPESPNETSIRETGSWTLTTMIDDCNGSFDHVLDDDCLRVYNTGNREGDYTFNVDHRWTSCALFRHPDVQGCRIRGGTCERGGPGIINCSHFNS